MATSKPTTKPQDPAPPPETPAADAAPSSSTEAPADQAPLEEGEPTTGAADLQAQAADHAAAEPEPAPAGALVAVERLGPATEALAKLFAAGEVTDAMLVALPIGNMPRLELGQGLLRPPAAKFAPGVPERGVAHSWVSDLDGTRWDLPFMIRPLHAETWWIEWPRDEAGNVLLDGTPPRFKTNDPEAARERWGDDSWLYRVQHLLALPKGAGVPHVFTFGGGSAATVGAFLQAATNKSFSAEDAERFDGVSEGDPCRPYMQVWLLGTKLEKSKRTGKDYQQATFGFQGVNLSRPGVLEAAKWAAVGEDVGLDSLISDHGDAREGPAPGAQARAEGRDAAHQERAAAGDSELPF